MSTPLANGDNGDRDGKGQFIPGNAAAKGRARPHAAKVMELREALLTAISSERIAKIVDALATAAESGDVQAARILFDRVLGPAVPLDVIERIEALETAMNKPHSRSAA